jgi:transposase InsO family protein
MGTIAVQTPWSVVSCDVVGPLPKSNKHKNDHIITFIDHFTNYPKAVAVRGSPTAQKVADCLFEQVISEYGLPRILLTDRGSNFTSKLFARLNKRMNLQHVTTTAYNPRCNGKNERLHNFLETAMYAFVSKKHRNWDQYLHAALMAYRTSPLTGIGVSPAYLSHGFHPRLPYDIIYGSDEMIKEDRIRFGTRFTEELKEAFKIVRQLRADNHRKAKDIFDNPRKPAPRYNPTFKEGDEVLLRIYLQTKGRSKKFLPRWSGPWKVVKRVTDLTCRIRKHDEEQLVNVRRLILYTPWTSDDIDDIYVHKLFDGAFGFLPKARLPSSDNTFKPPPLVQKPTPTPTVTHTRSGRKIQQQPLLQNGIIRGFQTTMMPTYYD